MSEKDYLKDISEIKNMMNKSSQFISLSGLSGVLAGIYALIGAFFAHTILNNHGSTDYIMQSDAYEPETSAVTSLSIIAVVIILLSVATGLIFSNIKAKKQGESLWNSVAKRLLINFMIPLFAGGTFTLILLRDEYFGLIAPVMLIFYGMACLNASKNTLRDVRYLGITMIIIGLTAAVFPRYGLYFWALGFGICHIFYGTVMHMKYDRK
ncbi:MAG TPA: hypothetical protein VF581_13135 [Flavobacterium sp.]